MVARAAQKSTTEAPTDGVSRARNGSWSLPAPSGAHAQLRAWTSGEAWFDVVMDTLRTEQGEAARRAAKVAPDTLLRVAYADRKSADQRTGRGVSTAHETVAASLGMSAKTVQRARLLLEALGLAVTVVAGRYLTNAERQEARRTHGGDQLRAASTRALVMPALPRTAAPQRDPRSVESVHLPVSPSGEQVSHVPKTPTTHALPRARTATAPRRPAMTKNTKQDRPPLPLQDQQLAAEFQRRIPWLRRPGHHIGALVRIVHRLRLSERGWTVGQALDQINRVARDSNLRVADPTDQRNPAGYLAWLLQRAIGTDELAPAVESIRERDERLAAQRARLAADAATRARVEAEADAIDAIVASMRTGRRTTRTL